MRSRSVLGLIVTAALGIATPVHAAGISRLCEMDRSGMPLACFYVKKSNLRTIIRDYSTGGPSKQSVVPQPTQWGGQTGDPISFPGIE